MALTQAQGTQLNILVTQEGSVENLITAIRALANNNTRNSALTTLMPAITCTVQDWTVANAYIDNVASGSGMFMIINALKVARNAQDASQLGPLLWALLAAVSKVQGV